MFLLDIRRNQSDILMKKWMIILACLIKNVLKPAKDIYSKLCRVMICEVFLCMVLKHSASLPWTICFLRTISNANWDNLPRLSVKVMPAMETLLMAPLNPLIPYYRGGFWGSLIDEPLNLLIPYYHGRFWGSLIDEPLNPLIPYYRGGFWRSLIDEPLNPLIPYYCGGFWGSLIALYDAERRYITSPVVVWSLFNIRSHR